MNKLVIIPESMYKNLVDYTDHVNIDHTKERLEKVKKARKLNASAKNVLYNQELRRYLAMRNAEINRPVKVEVVQTGTKYLTSPGRQFAPINEDGDIENADVASSISMASAPAIQAPEIPFETPARALSERSSVSEPTQASPQAVLLQYIRSNRHKFGITDNDKVIDRIEARNPTVINTSNLKKIVQHIINPRGARAPPGYPKFFTRAKEDARFRQLAGITQSVKFTTGARTSLLNLPARRFNPDIWQS